MVVFGVTMDGRFLPKSVEELLQSYKFNKVPLITGITDDEWGYVLPNVNTLSLLKSVKNCLTSVRIVQ